ncbi:aminoglycoside phosphotransferase family protein [Kineococcus endophyticus]|uniref:Aminoglycoside phosphotransferase family protein n=1 Tax=Kineococcus endophyticus TaxID=1181883 RepID=A0ABV3P9X6_9ACTN
MDVAHARRLVPAGLRESPALTGPDAQRWLDGLPDLVAASCARWSLEPDDGVPAHGAHALVLPVRRDGEACVLKLSHRDDDVRGEATALRTWAGRGAVRLLDYDVEGDVLLLERLDASRSLVDCPPEEVSRAVGRLLRELAVPAPDGTPTTAAEAEQIARTVGDRQRRLRNPLPERWVEASRRAAERLSGRAGAQTLVHADLTPDNVLRRPGAGRVVVDPKPLAGPPERSMPELLWRLVDHPAGRDLPALLRSICAAGGLDEGLAREWVVARTVDYWSWAVDVGLTTDPVRCRTVVAALV